jgi:hypothetical protein
MNWLNGYIELVKFKSEVVLKHNADERIYIPVELVSYVTTELKLNVYRGKRGGYYVLVRDANEKGLPAKRQSFINRINGLMNIDTYTDNVSNNEYDEKIMHQVDRLVTTNAEIKSNGDTIYAGDIKEFLHDAFKEKDFMGVFEIYFNIRDDIRNKERSSRSPYETWHRFLNRNSRNVEFIDAMLKQTDYRARELNYAAPILIYDLDHELIDCNWALSGHKDYQDEAHDAIKSFHRKVRNIDYDSTIAQFDEPTDWLEREYIPYSHSEAEKFSNGLILLNMYYENDKSISDELAGINKFIKFTTSIDYTDDKIKELYFDKASIAFENTINTLNDLGANSTAESLSDFCFKYGARFKDRHMISRKYAMGSITRESEHWEEVQNELIAGLKQSLKDESNIDNALKTLKPICLWAGIQYNQIL